MKLYFCSLFCAACLVLLTFADASTFFVTNPDDVVVLVRRTSLDKPFDFDIILETDLYFPDSTHPSRPLGMMSNGKCNPYSGTFEGNGHAIHFFSCRRGCGV